VSLDIDLDDNQFADPLPAWLIDAAAVQINGTGGNTTFTCTLAGNDFCHTPLPLTVEQLASVCTSFALTDTVTICGNCTNQGIPESACDDCAGVPAGSLVYDQCGVCGGNSVSCADCTGEPNGAAARDLCGVCNGNNGCIDCRGVVHGTARYDGCDVCGGDGTTCLDCTGQPNGPFRVDRCGVCGGTNECIDCAGVVNGGKVFDECGNCVDLKAPDYAPQCYDCTHVANGTEVRDLCGNCPARFGSCGVITALVGGAMIDTYSWVWWFVLILALLAAVLAAIWCCLMAYRRRQQQRARR
jgi:hypothetical protein